MGWCEKGLLRAVRLHLKSAVAWSLQNVALLVILNGGVHSCWTTVQTISFLAWIMQRKPLPYAALSPISVPWCRVSIVAKVVAGEQGLRRALRTKFLWYLHRCSNCLSCSFSSLLCTKQPQFLFVWFFFSIFSPFLPKRAYKTDSKMQEEEDGLGWDSLSSPAALVEHLFCCLSFTCSLPS